MPPRVVSSGPSTTETLLDWGVTPLAVTRFCEAPGVVTVGGTKNPDVAAIVACAPDLVVMDKEENRLADAEALEAQGVAVHVTHVHSVADVFPTLAGLAVAVGLPPWTGPHIRPETAGGPLVRAWVPIWRRPWMTINGDTYGSSLLMAAGISNVAQDTPDRYPVISLDAAAALEPDVVLAPSEPYAFGPRHRAELERVAPVIFVDGQDMFWWGSRTHLAVARFQELARSLRIRYADGGSPDGGQLDSGDAGGARRRGGSDDERRDR
jgi:ABC-type hemin transport system substrate-binding protein